MSDSDSNNSDTGRFKASKSTATHRTTEAARHDSAPEKRRRRSRSRDYDRRRDDRRRSRSRERRKSPPHYGGGRQEERRYRPEATSQKRHDDRNGAATTHHNHHKSAPTRDREVSDKRDDRHRHRGEERREEKKPGKLETHASAHSACLGPLLAEKTHAVEKLQSGENTDITATPSSSSSSESGEAPSFGPALPPSLQSKTVKNDETDDDAAKAGFCGPALPPHLKPAVEPSDTVEQCYGPQLPTQLAKERPQPVIIGPALPPNLSDLQSASNDPDPSSSDDEMLVGPMPESSNYVNYELEERALELKLGRLNQAGGTAKTAEGGREEWMLELPDIKNVTDLGLGARQFRTKERPDFSNRSDWTDTPDTKGAKHTEKTEQNRQLELEREAQRAAIAKRDAEYDKQAKKLRKKHKRDKSLMELHQKKLDKEKVRRIDHLGLFHGNNFRNCLHGTGQQGPLFRFKMIIGSVHSRNAKRRRIKPKALGQNDDALIVIWIFRSTGSTRPKRSVSSRRLNYSTRASPLVPVNTCNATQENPFLLRLIITLVYL
jgi:Protein of unknown function (DUF3752)